MKRFLFPLGLFLVLVVFLGIGLHLNPRTIPSPLIGKPAPAFALAQLEQASSNFSPKDMEGKVWMLNVWASWCVTCREEHPAMLEFSRMAVAPIVGLNYKDGRQEGIKWLKQFGNPYQLSVFDANGRVGIDYGVYGVPETFVIDKRGVIRLKHTGAITPEVIKNQFIPLIQELNRV